MAMVKNMANRKGFTLFEVLMVLAVLSTLSSIAYPSLMTWAQRSEFKSEVSTLVAWLHRAKLEAIKTNSFVVIEGDANGYSIFVDNSKVMGQAGDWFRQPDERQLTHHHLKNGHVLANNFPNNKARFSGRPGGKPGRFIFTDKNGTRMDVIISSVGRIRVERSKLL
jgi:prepilin-type N-terminal cleavage/methylation domain-containing protein